MLYEEHMTNLTHYFMDYSDSEFLLQLTVKGLQGDDITDDLQEFRKQIDANFCQITQKTDFPPEGANIYLPFIKNSNDLGIILIEKNFMKKSVFVYFDKQMPHSEEHVNFLQYMLELLIQPDFLNCFDI